MVGDVDRGDGLDLIYLGEFHSPSETQIVMALLRSSGIPVELGGGYDVRAYDKRILVPRDRLEDAKRVISEARKSDLGADGES